MAGNLFSMVNRRTTGHPVRKWKYLKPREKNYIFFPSEMSGSSASKKMKNFEVECEVKIPLDYKGFNSGLGFRLSDGKGKPIGYQCEIDRSKPAGIYGIGMGGWLYPTKTQQEEYESLIKGLFVAENWNHFRIICKGTSVTTFLNGKQIAKVDKIKEISGHFGIQHHGKGGTVKFRNLRARKL